MKSSKYLKLQAANTHVLLEAPTHDVFGAQLPIFTLHYQNRLKVKIEVRSEKQARLFHKESVPLLYQEPCKLVDSQQRVVLLQDYQVDLIRSQQEILY